MYIYLFTCIDPRIDPYSNTYIYACKCVYVKHCWDPKDFFAMTCAAMFVVRYICFCIFTCAYVYMNMGTCIRIYV